MMQIQNFNIFIHRLYDKQPVEIEIIQNLNLSPEQQCLACLITIFYNSAVNQTLSTSITLQGEVIQQLTKMLNQPEPASYLMKFDYENFFLSCNKIGQLALSRVVKGIYPLMKSQKFTHFRFFPFFSNSPNNLVGNMNWKQARKVLKQRYLYEKNSLSYPIKLAYSLLIGEFHFMNEYFTNDFEKLWAGLYTHYINEGLKIIEQDGQQEHFEPFKIENYEDCGIISEVTAFVLGKKGKADIQNMANRIYERYYQNEKFISVIMSLFHKSSNITLPTSFKWQQNQFFNRIFLNDDEIKTMYLNGNIKHLPNYDYGPELMSFICKVCVQKNQIIDKRAISYLKMNDKIQLLVNSELLGKQKGEEIVNILQENKEEFIIQLSQGLGTEIQKYYSLFLESWTYYYALLRNNFASFSREIYFLLSLKPELVHRNVHFSFPTKYQNTLTIILQFYVEALQSPTSELIQMGRSEQFQSLVRKVNENLRDRVWSLWGSALLKIHSTVKDLLKKEKPERRVREKRKPIENKISEPVQIILD